MERKSIQVIKISSACNGEKEQEEEKVKKKGGGEGTVLSRPGLRVSSNSPEGVLGRLPDRVKLTRFFTK